MNRELKREARPLILVFLVVNAIVIAGKHWLARKNVDFEVLLIGNILLFFASFFSFIITRKSLASKNPQAFMRAMYGGFIIKFFVLAIAAFVYIMLEKKNVSKPALIACAGLYIIYTSIETGKLVQMLKRKKNA